MSNNPPLLGGGAGSEISFSTLRDFYGDTNPVSLSEFTRGGSLVASTFAGASTATTSTGSGTKNDFVITQTSETVYTGNPGSFVIRQSASTTSANTPISITYTVNAGDSVLSLFGIAQSDFGDDPNNPGSPNIQVVAGFNLSINGGTPSAFGSSTFYYKGPAFQSGHLPSILAYQGTFSAGTTITLTTTSGNHSASLQVATARVSPSSQFDTTFKNNNSTGDTYTLASSSTRIGSNSQVYAAQASRLVADNSTSNQWTIAYDNVTGSGSGTAGDIAVTVTSQDDAGTETHNGGNGIASATAPSLSGISFVSVVAIAQDPNDEDPPTVRLKRNGTTVATHNEGTGNVAFVTYTGTINSGDVFTSQGGDQSNVVTINYTTPSRSIVFRNTGSSSLTIGSNSTGGARTIAASASSTVQTGGSTNNAAWQVHFDTSSGNCNVGIPATIGSGNPCNMDLFNTVTTPVG